MPRAPHGPLVVLSALVLTACSAQTPTPASTNAEPSIPVVDDAAAKRQDERKRKQAEDDARKAAALAELDALAVLPDKLPSNLDAACKQMLAAYDGFMRRALEGDQLTKWTTGGDEMQVAVFRKECLKRDIKVAACQTHALTAAGKQQAPHLADLLQRCALKFGEVGGAVAPPR